MTEKSGEKSDTRGAEGVPASPSGNTSARAACRIAVPAQHQAGGNHGATDSDDDRRGAPGAGAIAFRMSVRSALEPWPCNQDGAGSGSASRAAEQPHQRVARSNAAGARAGVPPAARAIDLPRRDSSEPDPWSLATPDRAIAVPDPDGRADERLAAWHNRHSKQKYSEHQRSIREVACVMLQGRAAMNPDRKSTRLNSSHSCATRMPPTA